MPFARRPELRLQAAPLLVLLAAACGHGEPFTAPGTDLDGPLAGGEPARLTFADAVADASWLPDGSSIIYSGARLVGDRLDHCLSVMPAAGGTVRREICNPSLFDDSITDDFASPAVSPEGSLAFYYANRPGGGSPAFAGIYATTLEAATLNAPAATTAVRSVPFQGADGILYDAVSRVRWLGESELLFLAHTTTLVSPCGTCDLVAINHPRTLFRASATPSAALTPVPGTDFATSVAVGATADEIYFTLANDPRVYRRVLSTGEQSVVHDFVAEGIVRDVHFGGGRLTAIVGGKLRVWLDVSGPLQYADDGGHLYLMEPATGAVRRLSGDDRWYRRPVLAPDGTALVGQGHGVVIDFNPNSPPDAIVLDTLVNPRGDLWRFGAP